MNVSNTRAEAALLYLADTDELCAYWRSEMQRCEYKAKSMKATAFKLASGTVAERQAETEVNDKVLQAWNEHVEAIKRYNTIENKRTTETLVLELWRSINANRRKAA